MGAVPVSGGDRARPRPWPRPPRCRALLASLCAVQLRACGGADAFLGQEATSPAPVRVPRAAEDTLPPAELELLGALAHDVEFRVRPLSSWPRIYEVNDFLTSEECQLIRERAEPHLEEALTVDQENGELRPDQSRTSAQMYFPAEDMRDDPIISGLVQRLHRLARMPLGHGERLQVGRYDVGQKYDCHFDSAVSHGLVRTVTILVYLSDVEAGGETLFPFERALDCQPLGRCCPGAAGANATAPERAKDTQHRPGPGHAPAPAPAHHHHGDAHATAAAPAAMRWVRPKRGRALLFYTHDLDGSLNRHAVHCACPVASGQKWILQAWFRSNLYPESPHYPSAAASGAQDAEELEL